MKIKNNFAHKSNYGSLRPISGIRYIVIHYTANDGDTDESNGNYFHNNVVGTSAHYFVDDDSITQTVPDNYVAWHCGAKTYKHASCRNANSLGIEICDDVKNGVIYPSAKTITNVLELVEHLMKKYSIPKENVIRHYDVTGKACPAYWVDDSEWKAEFWDKIGTGSLSELESVNDIVWELTHRGIISDKELWLAKLNADKDAYWLARKCANYIRGAG